MAVMGLIIHHCKRNALQTAQTSNDPVTSDMKYAIEKYKLDQRKHSFTLIEVTMAIAVIAVGMMGIMALFPIGFQAARNAIGDNCSSDMADQFLHVIAMQCKYYKDGVKDGWGEWITNDALSGWSDYDSSINQIITKPAAIDLETVNVVKGDGVFADADSDGYDDAGMYFDNDTPGVFYVESRSGKIVDFNGVMALWKEKIACDTNNDGVTNANEIDVDPADGVIDDRIPPEFGTRLCIEISWPHQVPYIRREKRYYVLEIFNPNSR